MNKFLNLSLALPLPLLYATLFLASPALAQRRSPRPAPKKVATPNPAKKSVAPSPTPTPVPTPTPEPFARATVEQMAAQCVKLDTDAGDIELKMLPEAAPETVRSFLNLVASGALDSTTFSRVVKNFVIQGGNLSNRETMTPAFAALSRRTIPDEPNPVRHERGIVSMARPDAPNSATTNFFVLVSTASQLDGTFTAFARVKSGMEVVDAINGAAVEGEKPVTPVRIKRAVVSECPVARVIPEK